VGDPVYDRGQERAGRLHASDAEDGRCRHPDQCGADGAEPAPDPPLDGGRIAVSLLPNRLAWRYARLEPYGFPILLVLLFTGILGDILWPLIAGFRYLLSIFFGF